MSSSNVEFLLQREMEQVFTDNDSGFSSNRIEIKIKAGEDWLVPVRVDHMFLARNYADDSFGDFRVVECLMLLGDVTHVLMPNRDNLLVELTVTPMNPQGLAVDITRKIKVKKFRGIVNTKQLPDFKLSNNSAVDPTAANLSHTSLIPVQIQLMDETVYKALTISLGLTQRNVTTMQSLELIYARYFKMVGAKEHERIDAFCIREGYNTEVRNTINIPDGTTLREVHRLLQDKEGGIYPTGMSRFIQNEILYVYPLYDFESYRKNLKILNIISIPSSKFQGAEITFKDEPLKLTILATGGVSSSDEGLVTSLTEGNAVRFGDANSLLSGSFERDNKVLVDRASNTYELGINKLETGINSVRAKTMYTANVYKELSDLARKQGRQIDITWNRGNADLLTPAMPVKFIRSSGERIEISYGVLLGVSENTVPTSASSINKNYASVVSLSIYVSRSTEYL